mmetsp:Transcript_9436/g.26749  ORF Transcript_9436/g.26749 Transcript_9436/m.26749 type:complete len:234 (+) Transcript_9436:53-754(+)
MSSSSFDLSLTGLNAFLATSVGRDKIGKFVHYGARGIAGLAADAMAAAPKGSPQFLRAQWVHDKARSLFVRIMDSRRTVRWLTSLSVIIALRKDVYPWKNRNAFIVAQVSFMFWQLVDHVRWLQQINWLPGDQARSKRISFTGFVISSLVSLWYFSGELRDEVAKGENSTPSKLHTLRLTVTKHFLTLISTLHISEIYLSHEFICGACGAIASGIDIYQTFPRKATKPEEKTA